MNAVRPWPRSLWLILAVALGLRLIGAWFGNLTFDESAHLALADTIDFHPDRFHLVWRTLDHPLLSLYLLKFSGVVFGTSNFGLRIVHVLFGAATIIPVFLLGRAAIGERAGLFAAALLAVDQFHASWSRLFMPEVPMLFFWSLGLFWLLRVVSDARTWDFVLLGVWFGLAYMAKETGFLLVPVGWLFLLSDRRHWRILTDPRWYLTHLVALVVVSPDLIWNLLHYSESYLLRNAEMLSESFRLQFKPWSLYLGELFRLIINEQVLDVDYEEGNAFCCYWPAGLLYLASVIMHAGQSRIVPIRLLLIGFGVPFVFFLLLPGGERFDPFWWASSSLISAVVLAGCFLERLTRRSRGMVWLGLLLVAWFGGHYLPLAMRPGGPMGQGYPRTTIQQLAENAILDARESILRRDFVQARRQLIYALNVGGPNPVAFYLFAHACLQSGDYDAAEAFVRKCLELEPGHPKAEQLLEEVLRRK